MNTPTLQIRTPAGKVQTLDLKPATYLRLLAYAAENELSVAKMADLAIRYATAPEDKGPRLRYVEEEEIVEYAATIAFAKP